MLSANSAASNYCFDTGCSFVSTDGELIDVNVASDAWDFENSPKYFQATAEDLGSYLTDEHLSAFMENSTNSDYAYTKTMLNNIFGFIYKNKPYILYIINNTGNFKSIFRWSNLRKYR